MKTQKSQLNTPPAPTRIVERNLVPVSPLKEQFEPTVAAPIPQRVRMAGGG